MKGVVVAVPIGVLLWCVIIWIGLSCVGCAYRPAMKTDIDRIVGISKEIQQHNYEHQEAQRDAISKTVQTAGVKDSTFVVLGVVIAGAIVGGVYLLIRHDERMRGRCGYPGTTATVSP